jgi:hypothetical protein
MNTWDNLYGPRPALLGGEFSSGSRGANRTAPDTENWTAGPLFADN